MKLMNRITRSHKGYTSIALATLMVLLFLTMSSMLYALVSGGLKRTYAQTSANQALAIAESRVEKAKTYIMGSNSVLDTNEDGIINGLDDVAGNWITVEDSTDGKLMIYGNIRTFTSDTRLQEHFIVKASGISDGTYRAVEAKLGYLSFLKFARFVEGSISYGKGAQLTGMVYADGNISIPTGTGGPHVIFKKDVITTGSVSPKGTETVENHEWDYVHVEGTLEEYSSKNYTTQVSAQFDFFKAAAQSQWGLYINNTLAAKLGNSNKQGSSYPTDNLIDLSLFKGLGTNDAYYDADNDDVYTAATDIEVPDDFNGMVYWGTSDKVHVKGELTGKCMSIFTDSNLYVDGSITTGSDNDGYPVNLGLVSKYYLYWSQQIPSIFEVNAGIFVGYSGYGVEDSDNSPYDNDNSHGWMGETRTPPFYFKVYGPLVTHSGGSNKVWVNYGNDHPGVTTREWLYDVDITTFPPPFPIVEGVLVNLSFREMETRF